MSEVPADADPRLIDVDRGRVRVAGGVIKADIVVNPVADRLHSLPPQRGGPEQVQGRVRQHVGQAIATGQHVDEDLARQILDPVLDRYRADLVQRGRRGDVRVVTQARLPHSDHDSPGVVAVHVDEVGEGRAGLDIPRLAFNRNAAVRAGAHQHDGRHRKRRVEAKLAPAPVSVCAASGETHGSTTLSDHRQPSSLSARRATRRRADRGHIHKLLPASCRSPYVARSVDHTVELRVLLGDRKVLTGGVIGPRSKTTHRSLAIRRDA